ncbi:MAG: pentapeptide repeat-containing protein, partial [Candidatus Eremiobacteraeota bacterium]|nr:pentapeptide repeat-containing protein [Candidatus Eremiobacteraeota bacterium]
MELFVGALFTALLTVAAASGLPSNCTGCSFAHRDLHGLDFSGVNYVGVDFAHSNLQHVNLRNANLTGADFRDADL